MSLFFMLPTRKSTAYSLSGFDSSYTDDGTATTTYTVNIIFRTDGTVDVTKLVDPSMLNEVNPYASDVAACWVRCTHNSGIDMTAGAARGIWHQCNTERIFTMSYASGGGFDQITGNFKFELSSSASGTPVVATVASCDVTVGETS